jgi:hypothetical protein
MHKIEQHKYYPLVLFSVGLVVVLYSVNYLGYLFNHASGVHFWRQADSISFVGHYYERGMHFFEPGTYNATSTDARGASEFPILYYITAALWHVFGRHEFILKIINSLLFFGGFYCLYKIAIKQIGNIYTALAITLLLMSSSVLLFYANSFMPDAPAFGLCLMGAYFYFRFTETKQYSNYVWAYVLFTLSVLIKVNMAVFPLAVLGLVLLEKIFRLRLQGDGLFTGNGAKYLLPPFIMIALVTCWALWTRNYNAATHNEVFLTGIKPYWEASALQLENTVKAITEYWYAHYYFFTTWHVFYVILAIGILCIRRWNRLALWLCAMLLIGTVGYVALFYTQFESHDYYIIPVFIPLAFTVIFSVGSLFNKAPWLRTSYIPTIVLFFLVILSFKFTDKLLRYRSDYKTWNDMNPEIFEISGKLENYGVPKGQLIFSFPDHTPNASLYYLQRQGYTNSSGYTPEEVPAIIKPYIIYGIRYLVITDPAYYQFAQSHWYKSKEVGAYKRIKVFYVYSFRGDLAN